MTIKNLRNNEKFKIFVWTLFDFANTSYSIVVVTFLYAVYFKHTVANGEPVGDFYWSVGTSISMLITAIVSPVLGAIADYSAGKKRFLLFFTALCILSTLLLYFVGSGDLFFGLVLFIIANIGFEAGLVFYDAFLPEITKESSYGRVSGYGFAMGYLGSFTTLLVVYPFIERNMIKETFPLSALVFLIFALPLFLFLKDSRKSRTVDESYFSIGFGRVTATLKNLKNYRNLVLFLVSYFFFIEGVNTVIYFSGNYASTTLSFSMKELIVFFMIVQTTAIIGSVIFGIISDSIGQKKSLIISLSIWIVTILLAYFTSSADSPLIVLTASIFNLNPNSDGHLLLSRYFYLVGLLAGMVMGATQSISRSLMSKLTPYNKKTEFFGFYSFFGKSSAILGPLVFGITSYLTGSQKYAILSIGIFFVIGLLFLGAVRDK
ncbi:MFS transporter [Melioribacter sp. Ez-97]|uniref:MFS transporter n=1 Tax=Melioribacter sp. Ez-97 TaxID=3423434 RepID=UPI003EDB3AC5